MSVERTILRLRAENARLRERAEQAERERVQAMCDADDARWWRRYWQDSSRLHAELVRYERTAREQAEAERNALLDELPRELPSALTDLHAMATTAHGHKADRAAQVIGALLRKAFTAREQAEAALAEVRGALNRLDSLLDLHELATDEEGADHPQQWRFEDGTAIVGAARQAVDALNSDGTPLLAEVEKYRAMHQQCHKGHKYMANSHEYPCPVCELGKAEAEVEALREKLADTMSCTTCGGLHNVSDMQARTPDPDDDDPLCKPCIELDALRRVRDAVLRGARPLACALALRRLGQDVRRHVDHVWLSDIADSVEALPDTTEGRE